MGNFWINSWKKEASWNCSYSIQIYNKNNNKKYGQIKFTWESKIFLGGWNKI